MFNNFEKIRTTLMAECDQSVVSRRIPYMAIYTIIEEYIRTNQLIVSTRGRMLKSLAVGMFVYDIFCQNCEKNANELANTLAELDEYVEMSTKLPRQKITITIRCVTVVTLYSLPAISRGPAIGVSAIFSTTTQPGRFCNMLHFSNEIELIEVYHMLYCLHNVADWADLAELEMDMYATISHKIGGKQRNRIAKLKRPLLSTQTTGHAGTRPGKSVDIAEYIATAMHTLSPMVIFISETAKALLTNKSVIRLQCITWQSPKIIMANLNAVFGRELGIKKCKIDAPFDVRLCRYTVHIGKHVLADIYNSARYEPVPVVRYQGHAIGNIYVLLRFTLLDMYLVKFLQASDRIHAETATAIRRKLLSMLLLFRDAGGAATDDYVGTYVPLSVYEKKKQAATKVKRYVPRLYKSQNGTYRTFKFDSRR